MGSVPFSNPWILADAAAAGMILLLHGSDVLVPHRPEDEGGALSWRTLDELELLLVAHQTTGAGKIERQESDRSVLRTVAVDAFGSAYDAAMGRDGCARHDADLADAHGGISAVGAHLLYPGGPQGESGSGLVCIDRAVAGYDWVEVSGWAIADAIDAIRVVHDAVAVYDGPLLVERDDVVAAFPMFAAPHRCGFHIRWPLPRGSEDPGAASFNLLSNGAQVATVEIRFWRALSDVAVSAGEEGVSGRDGTNDLARDVIELVARGGETSQAGAPSLGQGGVIRALVTGLRRFAVRRKPRQH